MKPVHRFPTSGMLTPAFTHAEHHPQFFAFANIYEQDILFTYYTSSKGASPATGLLSHWISSR